MKSWETLSMFVASPAMTPQKFALQNLTKDRSSHRSCSLREGVLRNFAKFTRKHLCQGLFFNKVAGLEACNFIKKETVTQVFSCGFCEISKNTFFTETLWWLLLKRYIGKKIDNIDCPTERAYLLDSNLSKINQKKWILLASISIFFKKCNAQNERH